MAMPFLLALAFCPETCIFESMHVPVDNDTIASWFS